MSCFLLFFFPFTLPSPLPCFSSPVLSPIIWDDQNHFSWVQIPSTFVRAEPGGAREAETGVAYSSLASQPGQIPELQILLEILSQKYKVESNWGRRPTPTSGFHMHLTHMCTQNMSTRAHARARARTHTRIFICLLTFCFNHRNSFKSLALIHSP